MSAKNLKGVVAQSETESETSVQSRQLDQVQQFMKIIKVGARIKKSMLPKI
jgi:hypothetical protein